MLLQYDFFSLLKSTQRPLRTKDASSSPLSITPSSPLLAKSHSSQVFLSVKSPQATGATCVLATRIISKASSKPGSKCLTALRPAAVNASKVRTEQTSPSTTSQTNPRSRYSRSSAVPASVSHTPTTRLHCGGKFARNVLICCLLQPCHE